MHSRGISFLLWPTLCGPLAVASQESSGPAADCSEQVATMPGTALLQREQHSASSQVVLNATDDEASGQQCIRVQLPSGMPWCSHEGSTYKEVDCDGDGIRDPYCVDVWGRTGFIASATSCKPNWPGTRCQGQPGSGQQCIRVKLRDGKPWCSHEGSTYKLLDCDGDGTEDHYCTDSVGRTGILSSADGCKSTWPRGGCLAGVPISPIPAPVLAPSPAPMPRPLAGSFAADWPGKCCSHEPVTHLLWSQFRKTEDFLLNTSKQLPIVVPCGTRVTMDEETVGLAGLQVHGSLDFQDSVDIILRTAYIFVCGSFSIGSMRRAHQSKVEIILDTSNDTQMTWMGPKGEKKFGVGPFVTYGGDLFIRGSKCGSALWARLQETVQPTGNPEAEHHLKLRDGTTAWKHGDELVIAPSDREASHYDTATVLSHVDGLVRAKGKLNYQHLGGPPGELATEVVVLTHNVVIRGHEGCEPSCGHFMLAHTNRGHICGAAFTNLGQTATEGRYPLHIHLAGDAPHLVVKDNSLSFNHNRGVVMHGVNNMLVENNVCFRTRGHCFMTEDGVEQYNHVFRNWGFVDRGQSFGCRQSHDSTFTCAHRSDDRPQAFWISNPKNYYDGNIGIALFSFAFFTEARHVMGLSRRNYPIEWKKVNSNGKIKGSVPFLQFTNNEAHSSPGGVGNYPRHSFGRECIHYENFTGWRNHQAMAGHGGCWTFKGAHLYENYNGIRAFTSPIHLEQSEISSNGQAIVNRGRVYPSCPAVIRFATRTSFSWLKKMVTADGYTKQWIREHGNYEWSKLGGFMGPFE